MEVVCNYVESLLQIINNFAHEFQAFLANSFDEYSVDKLKMSFTICRKQNEKRILQIQSRIDDIIVFDEDLPKDCKFSFIDFASTQKFIISQGIKSAKYSEIMKFANQWLMKNNCWEVLGCETIPAIMQLLIDDKGQIQSKQILTTYSITDEITRGTDARLGLNRGQYQAILLRFWIKRIQLDLTEAKLKPNIQKIRYKDFAPKIVNHNEFETIDQVVNRVNDSIKSEEINGKIINIQTLSCSAAQDWSFDPEDTRPMNLIGKYVYILRVFYELGPIHEEQIGLADFVPECLSGGNLFKRPKFESQSEILRRASKWLSDNPEISFCSAISIDVKLKSMTSINTRQMWFTRETGDFIRILRIAYTKPQELPENIPLSSTLPPPPPLYLQCETFPLHKSYSEVKRSISEFFSRDEWSAEEKYKWCFLNCETVFVLAANKRVFETNINESFRAVSTSRSSINAILFFAVKIYYDVGFYGIDHNEVTKAGQSSTKTNENKNEPNACLLM